MSYYIASYNEYKKISDKSIFTEYVRISNGLPDDLKADSHIKDWAFLAPYQQLEIDYLSGIKSEPEMVNAYLQYLEKIWPSYCFIFGCHGQGDGSNVLMLCPEENTERYNLRTMLKFFMKCHGYPLTDFTVETGLNATNN